MCSVGLLHVFWPQLTWYHQCLTFDNDSLTDRQLISEIPIRGEGWWTVMLGLGPPLLYAAVELPHLLVIPDGLLQCFQLPLVRSAMLTVFIMSKVISWVFPFG